jgi:hypothetical protein
MAAETNDTDSGGRYRRIYVARSRNRRLQVFDRYGNFLRPIPRDLPFDPTAWPAIGKRPQLQITGPRTVARRALDGLRYAFETPLRSSCHPKEWRQPQ